MTERVRLPAHVIEALAHDRLDLLTGAEHELVDRARTEDASHVERLVEQERELSHAFGRTLGRASDDVDVDALVRAAMASADESTERASTRALAMGGAFGVLVAMTSGVLALSSTDEGSLGAIRRVGSLLRAGMTLTLATSRAVDALPGGAAGIGIFVVLSLAVLVALAKRLDFGMTTRAGGALSLCFAVALSPTVAHAYDLEGVLPASAVVSVDVDRAPRSFVLTEAARSAGLGLAYTLPNDPQVTLHVHGAPLADVLSALLGPDELVEVSGQLLVVRPSPAPPLVVVQPMMAEHRFEPTLTEPNWAILAPPMPPPLPARPSPLPDRRVDLNDVMTFGQDARIGRDQEVRDVVTAGGDATVDGRVYGSVVTMGGDAEISGTVVGDVVTMGGDIHVSENGHVHGRLDAMGGNVSTDSPSTGSATLAITSRDDSTANDSGGGDFVWALLRYSLLFLLSIAFLAVSPERFARVSRAMVDRPMRVITTGGLGLVGGALFLVALVVSLVGIPAALALLVASPLVAATGLSVVVAVIGTALPIPSLAQRPVSRLAAGAAVLFVVTRIPVVGGLAIFIALLAGLGALILTRMGSREPV